MLKRLIAGMRFGLIGCAWRQGVWGERMWRWLVAVKRRSALFVVRESSSAIQLLTGLYLVFRRDWGREAFRGVVTLANWYGRGEGYVLEGW